MVSFNRRFDPHFQAVKQAIVEGQIGEVGMVTIISRDPGAPPADYVKRSGGIFRDMTIHDFDMARFLLGEEPETVFAVGSVLVDPEIGTPDPLRLQQRIAARVGVADRAALGTHGRRQLPQVGSAQRACNPDPEIRRAPERVHVGRRRQQPARRPALPRRGNRAR